MVKKKFLLPRSLCAILTFLLFNDLKDANFLKSVEELFKDMKRRYILIREANKLEYITVNIYR